MKKINIFVVFLLLLLCSGVPVQASSFKSSYQKKISIKSFENGDYIKTVVTTTPPLTRASSATRGSKTATYKNSRGTILWSVTVKGSFSYIKGKSSTCTFASGSASSASKNWKVGTPSVSKSRNSASASVKSTQYMNGKRVGTASKNITLSCNIHGKLS